MPGKTSGKKNGATVLIPSDDPLHTNLDAAERRLFFSLWLLLILAFALWHFWPTIEGRTPASRIPIEIGAELRGRFTQASLFDTRPSEHTISIQFSPKYLHSLPEQGHRVNLGYDLLGDRHVLFSGIVVLDLGRRTDETAQIVLPNPERVFTRSIRIYLAR